MFGDLLKRIREARAASAWRRSPLGKALTAHVNEFLSYQRFAEMGEEGKQELIADFSRRVDEVLQSENPVMKCRESLAGYMVAFAELAVLCLTEEEKPGQLYADCPYISGELHRDIEKAVPHVEFLREIKWKFPNESTEGLAGLCNARSGRWLFYVNGLNELRFHLKDFDKQKDWFHPFHRAMMIWQEDSLRGKMGLPSLLPGNLDGLKYSTFMNVVLNGAANPYYEWEKAWEESPAGVIPSSPLIEPR